MNTYLAIITTVLVLTQIVRVTQNAIQLRKYDISKSDFNIQREVFRLLLDKLRSADDGLEEWERNKE